MKKNSSKLLPVIIMIGMIGSYSSPSLTDTCTPCGGSMSIDGEVQESAGNCDPIWKVTKESYLFFFEKIKCETGGSHFCPKPWHILFPCPKVEKEIQDVPTGD